MTALRELSRNRSIGGFVHSMLYGGRGTVIRVPSLHMASALTPEHAV